MWWLRRIFSRPKEEPLAGAAAMSGLADQLGSRLRRMHELVAARRTAVSSAQIPAIDEEMDQVCREMAQDIEAGRHEEGPLVERVQRMKQLMLEELRGLRDNARRGL